MKFFHATGLALAGSALVSPVSAHSWVEYASKLARNGTMIGKLGYPRGFVPRDSTNPSFTDDIPQNILPVTGQSAYSGEEILNKYKLDKNPQFPMLEAAAGDYIAIMHLENGHTTLPENQPNKPRNRGTIYFYGTTQPKDEEKLFDVHLRWNRQGTGGDKRGKLISTRNYDDGQCYQPNAGQLSTGRSNELKPKGAIHEKELACQSDLKLPSDLKAGDIYTIYWYWDWPDLNGDKIDMEATKNGKFPWAGTFMRGEKDPNGFSADAIARNESYSSVIDIKITGSEGFAAKDQNILEYVDNQNIYSAGIEEQMKSNFQVDVDGGKGDGSVPSYPSSPASPTATAPVDGGAGNGGDVATVTVTATVKPSPVITTVYVTVPSESLTAIAPEPVDGETSTKTITTTALVTKSKVPSDAVPTPPTASTVYETLYTTRPKEQPTGGDLPQQPQPSTVIKTIVTHINTPSSSGEASAPSAQPTFPGGEFREDPPANGGAPTQTQSDGPPIPTPFLRRRQNWVFGNF
ncbi:hypothetical protein FLONG3_7492 [Fusarium longipes]|uniref:DUF7492 domain-containing protein n=1 Tax=Fusarium longipes TaxID=694270 RepID=A0A395SD15_9HYPO|nr:hypothetical protein FLONG3_7492 [Fusarium longipes]